MDIMGWSDTAMAKRYQHVTDKVRPDIAKRVGGLVWEAAAGDEGKGGGVTGEAVGTE
jgi:integrase